MRVSETKKQREEPPPPNLANSDLAVLVETLEYLISLFGPQVTSDSFTNTFKCNKNSSTVIIKDTEPLQHLAVALGSRPYMYGQIKLICLANICFFSPIKYCIDYSDTVSYIAQVAPPGEAD